MRKLINLTDMLEWDSTILDNYELPDTVVISPDYDSEPTYSITLDHDLMSSTIMMRLGLMTPIYQEPDVFKSALDTWFLTHKWNIEHLMRLACQDYNPLENYDRWEHIRSDEKLSGTDAEIHSGADTDRASGTDTERHSGTDTVENTVSAMNASTYQPDTKSVTTYGERIDTDYGKTSTYTHGENINTNYGKNTNNTTNNHMHGNIGTTTYDQMFRGEIGVIKSFNVYDSVVSLIENDLFLGVY